jgi:nucleoid DNA-binding protein
MAENKTKPTKLSVAAFIAALTDRTRRADAKALVKLMQSVTAEKPKMWGTSIIGFGSYHYKYESGREGDTPVVGFSPRKAATVLYNVGGFDGSEALRAKLGKHTSGKGCLYIKKLAEIDQQVLETLVLKSVSATRARYPSEGAKDAGGV